MMPGPSIQAACPWPSEVREVQPRHATSERFGSGAAPQPKRDAGAGAAARLRSGDPGTGCARAGCAGTGSGRPGPRAPGRIPSRLVPTTVRLRRGTICLSRRSGLFRAAVGRPRSGTACFEPGTFGHPYRNGRFPVRQPGPAFPVRPPGSPAGMGPGPGAGPGHLGPAAPVPRSPGLAAPGRSAVHERTLPAGRSAVATSHPGVLQPVRRDSAVDPDPAGLLARPGASAARPGSAQAGSARCARGGFRPQPVVRAASGFRSAFFGPVSGAERHARRWRSADASARHPLRLHSPRPGTTRPRTTRPGTTRWRAPGSGCPASRWPAVGRSASGWSWRCASRGW